MASWSFERIFVNERAYGPPDLEVGVELVGLGMSILHLPYGLHGEGEGGCEDARFPRSA